jgi:hypothetical protein
MDRQHGAVRHGARPAAPRVRSDDAGCVSLRVSRITIPDRSGKDLFNGVHVEGN